jgi:hypothetical protein
MRKLCCASLAATIGLMLAGCGQQSPAVDPVAAVAQLSTGAPLLRCRAECVVDWRRAQPYAAQLEAMGRWAELAALVITVNYQDDLALYYLARAADGLGYPTAAISYYRQSTYISGTALSCQHESGVCGGVVLPNAALARIEALESEARQPRLRPPRSSATGARPPRNGAKPVSGEERKLRPPTAPELEPQPPGAVVPELRQSTVPSSQPREPFATAPGQNQFRPSEQRGTGPEPPPPARTDPVAKQYIEPPAAH